MVISASDDPDELPSRPNVNVIIAPHIIAQASPSVSICAPPSHSTYVWLYSDTLPTNCIRTDTAVHQMLLSTIPWETLKTEHSAGKENIHVEFIVISVCAPKTLASRGYYFCLSLSHPLSCDDICNIIVMSQRIRTSTKYAYAVEECIRRFTLLIWFISSFVLCLLHKRHIMCTLSDPGQRL